MKRWFHIKWLRLRLWWVEWDLDCIRQRKRHLEESARDWERLRAELSRDIFDLENQI